MKMPPSPSKPPQMLIAAFIATEKIEDVAALTVEDGFDAQTMRVLIAWQKTEQTWIRPRRVCPDEMRPTPAAWKWLVSGWTYDLSEIANAADVSHATVRAKMGVLIGTRLIYPDGTVSKFVASAMRAYMGMRLGVKATKKQEPAAKKPDTDAN